jgi:hypothetical protein
MTNQDPKAAADLKPAPIDGQRAYSYLTEICSIGPRIAGTAANARQRKMVAEHFERHGAKVVEQVFAGRDPESGERLEYVNLIASWNPERGERVLLGVHYDTRPYPDREVDPMLQRRPFLGANDGASGVALLMEMAHHMSDLPTQYGVDFVLFDAEERVYGAHPPSLDNYFLGSKHFAKRYRDDRRRDPKSPRYIAGLVLDMIGDRELTIPQEGYSRRLQPRLVREVWDVARRIGAKAFVEEAGIEVSDDHLPLIDAGIPAIDLIDFDYPHWHRSTDTPDQCAPESLAQVGRVVTAWLTTSIGGAGGAARRAR